MEVTYFLLLTYPATAERLSPQVRGAAPRLQHRVFQRHHADVYELRAGRGARQPETGRGVRGFTTLGLLLASFLEAPIVRILGTFRPSSLLHLLAERTSRPQAGGWGTAGGGRGAVRAADHTAHALRG
jgi:hypothetical protein